VVAVQWAGAGRSVSCSSGSCCVRYCVLQPTSGCPGGQVRACIENCTVISTLFFKTLLSKGGWCSSLHPCQQAHCWELFASTALHLLVEAEMCRVELLSRKASVCRAVLDCAMLCIAILLLCSVAILVFAGAILLLCCCLLVLCCAMVC
jgi:hypothetical protein